MGVVWKALQVKLNRVVALKMILGGRIAGRKELIRFLAEAEAVAAIKHPHVVHVHEYGEADGRPFLAMEYLSGGSLTERPEQNGLARRTMLRPSWRGSVAGAIRGAAHDQGIVHPRPLSQETSFTTEHGEPKVTDFGLAKRTGGSDLTATQAVMGTPAYMAPRAARGTASSWDPVADVYSLGVILYEGLDFDAPIRRSGLFNLRPLQKGHGGRARTAGKMGAGGVAPGRRVDLLEVPREDPGRAVPDGQGPSSVLTWVGSLPGSQ